MLLRVPADSIPTNKSQSFSIVWVDDTDSVCDLPCLLTTRSRTTGGRTRRSSNGAADPSSLPSSSPLPHHPLPQYPPSNASTSTVGIFSDIHSRPGDLVDFLTRSGSFAFLSDLFDTERLFELHDFRIPRVIPKGESIEKFVTSIHLVLDLANKYPHDSLSVHILDVMT